MSLNQADEKNIHNTPTKQQSDSRQKYRISNLRRVVFLLLACIMAAFYVPLFSKDDGILRYTLAAGANYGGPGRETLRYAVSDAKAFVHVLNTIGGVKGENCVVLVDPDLSMLRDTIKKIKDEFSEQMKGRSIRTEFIFYYSGHSDEEGLLLGNQKLGYRELRDLVNDIPADVKIAVLDSCSSGAFTRIKGGAMVSPFMSGKTNSMKGFAFMTSSSADEVSQESERIKGSFFTHFLLSGLRGAADMTRDKKVTLNEAYQYAYRETLTRTQKTAGGAQHPNYNIQMSGTGDVVLTEISTGSSTLAFGDTLGGKVFVNSDPSVVAELNKIKGEPLYLSIDPGSYHLVLDKDGMLYETRLKIGKGESVVVQQTSFSPVKREGSVMRGGASASSSDGYTHRIIDVNIFPFPFVKDTKNSYDYLFYVFGSYCDRVNRSAVGLGLSVVREDQSGFALSGIGTITGNVSKGVVISGIFNTTNGDASGVHIAGATNVSMRNSKGVQISGLANIVGGDQSGIQIAGLANVVSGSAAGIQMAGLANVASQNFSGIQISYAANIIREKGAGIQLSLVNIADQYSGLQIGLVDIGGSVSGVQLGLVNISKTFSGVQLGLVNYSEDNDGVPVGLVSIVKNGITAPMVFADETGMMNYALTHGSKRVYNLFVFSHEINSRFNSYQSFGSGLGIGVRWMPGSWILSLDALSQTYYARKEKENYSKNSIRFTFGYDIFRYVNIFGGVSVSQMNQITNRYNDKSVRPFKPMHGYYKTWSDDGDAGWLWPGGYVGIQIVLGRTD
jgi:Caspase domain